MYNNEKRLKKISNLLGFALLIFSGLFAFASIVYSVMYIVFSADEVVLFEESTVLTVVEMLMRVIAFTVPVLLFTKMLQKNNLGLTVQRPKLGRLPKSAPLIIFAVVAIIYCSAYLNYYITALIPGYNQANELLVESGGSLDVLTIVLMFISTAVIPGIFEELMFRGLLLPNLMPFGRAPAVVISALMFGIMHGNPSQLFFATAAGLALGYVYIKTESLLLCMLIHFANNALSVLDEVMYTILPKPLGEVFSSIMMLSVLVLGIASVILLLVKNAREHKKDNGSFGIILPPGDSYEEFPVATDRKMCGYLTIPMIIFMGYYFFNVIAYALLIMLTGAIVG